MPTRAILNGTYHSWKTCTLQSGVTSFMIQAVDPWGYFLMIFTTLLSITPSSVMLTEGNCVNISCCLMGLKWCCIFTIYYIYGRAWAWKYDGSEALVHIISMIDCIEKVDCGIEQVERNSFQILDSLSCSRESVRFFYKNSSQPRSEWYGALIVMQWSISKK